MYGTIQECGRRELVQRYVASAPGMKLWIFIVTILAAGEATADDTAIVCRVGWRPFLTGMDTAQLAEKGAGLSLNVSRQSSHRCQNRHQRG